MRLPHVDAVRHDRIHGLIPRPIRGLFCQELPQQGKEGGGGKGEIEKKFRKRIKEVVEVVGTTRRVELKEQ